MAISIKLVPAGSFAAEASSILSEAWPPPSIRYSREYLEWQLTFPSIHENLPAAAAFDGSTPIGFAAVTARRLRLGSRQFESGVVSFVAVRPMWRAQGIAGDIYKTLLQAIRERDMVVMTFAVADSGGERALLRAYKDAGFQTQTLGVFANYAYMVRPRKAESEWTAEISEDDSQLEDVLNTCGTEPDVVWSNPGSAQIAHYRKDPRGRKLAIARRGSEIGGAAWITRSELQTAAGTETLTLLDSVWLPPAGVAALPVLFECAAASSLHAPMAPAVIGAPNLAQFSPEDLRKVGIRQTGARFHGYLCSPSNADDLKDAKGTNIEIV
jgi:hypothetical protein